MDCAPVVLAHEPPFRIGDAEFRPATREAIHEGQRSVIEPRVMQLLIALHRANGAVVTKDDLARQCWDGRVVGEDAINRVISRLRSVAREQAGGQFGVETITRVGYRLTGPGVPAGASAPRRIGRRQLLVAGTAAAVAAAAGIGWYGLKQDDLPREARLLLEDARPAFVVDDANQHANAVAQLRRAAELAPSSAEIWGLLALAYMKRENYAPSSERPDLRSRGLAAARRALAIDGNQPDARAALIHARPLYRNWFDRERRCRSALAEHPRHLELNFLLGGLLSSVGRIAEVLPLAQTCIEQAPLHPSIHFYLAGTLNELGRLDEAEAVIERGFALWPRRIDAWFARYNFLLYTNRADEAVAMVRNTAGRPSQIPDRNFDLIELQAEAIASRDPAQIRAALAAFEKAAERGTGYAENAAKFAGAMGDVDMAYRILDALYFGRGFAIPEVRFEKEQGRYSGPERHTYFLFWRLMRAVRADPRFAQLTKALGLDDYWERSGSRHKVAP